MPNWAMLLPEVTVGDDLVVILCMIGSVVCFIAGWLMCHCLHRKDDDPSGPDWTE